MSVGRERLIGRVCRAVEFFEGESCASYLDRLGAAAIEAVEKYPAKADGGASPPLPASLPGQGEVDDEK